MLGPIFVHEPEQSIKCKILGELNSGRRMTCTLLVEESVGPVAYTTMK